MCCDPHPPRLTHPSCQELEANLNHIARHACRYKQTEPCQRTLTEPYGHNIYPKLVRTLDSPQMELRVKALDALLSIFGQKDEHVVRAVGYNATEPLVRRLSDDNATARALAGKCLMRIASSDVGLKTLLENDYTAAVLAAVDDIEPDVAVEALSCLAAMDHCMDGSQGTDALIKANCIPKYIAKAKTGPPAVAEHALFALCKVLDVKEAFITVLDKGAMDVLAELLCSTHDNVLQQACETVAKLCFYSAGKRSAVRLGVLGHLKPLLSSESHAVRRAATAALMTITLDNDGKQQAIDTGVVELIAAILTTEVDAQAQSNLLKAAANCAESPKARQILAPLLPKLNELARSETPLVARSAARAAAMVEWKPGTTMFM